MSARAPLAGRLRPQSFTIDWLPTFFTLMERDARVLRRQFKPFLARTVMQPFFFVFIFTYVLPKTGGSLIGFQDVLVPGLIAMTIVLQGIQSVAFPLVQEFSFTKEIEDRIMAPLPVWGVAAEKLLFALLQTLIAVAVVFPLVYFVPSKTPHLNVEPLVLATVLPIGALTSASMGLLIGVTVSPRQLPLVFALIVIPVMFLGAVYYPWHALHVIKWLQIIVLINPLVYISEGLRAGLTAHSDHMPLAAVYGGLIAGAIVCTPLGVRGFRRRVLA